jgi:hypothetical protein
VPPQRLGGRRVAVLGAQHAERRRGMEVAGVGSLAEPVGGASPVASVLKQPAEPKRGTAVAITRGTLQVRGRLILAAEARQRDAQFAKRLGLAVLRRLA